MSQPKPKSFPIRIVVAAAGLALVVLAFAAWLTPTRSGQPLIGGAFSLQDGEGKTITEKDMLGHPYLVYFGYTHCPDVCPTTLAQISDVLAKLPDKPARALFITVDPERDTPKAVGDYVSSFDKRILGLSGSVADIEATEKAFRVYARRNPAKDGEYSMDHSSVVYLMDKNGRFVEAFNLERSATDAAKELDSYL